MKKILMLLAAISLSSMAIAQESNGNKTIWAKSFLNEKAPELVVEKYLTPAPDFKGKFVLVEFWATWCGPCRKSIPKLNALQTEFKDDLVVVGLSNEKEDVVKDMISPKIEYTSAIDTKSVLKNTFEVKGVPHAVLISPDGVVVWEGFPLLEGFDLNSEVVGNLIKKYKK
ncbi:MAG: thioredoxin-like domain-containing protein [Rikenellaceae bacterium]